MNVINGAINKKDVDSVTTFIRSIIQILEFRIGGEEVNVQILVRQKKRHLPISQRKGIS